MEMWKKIEEFENYEVSSEGHIRRGQYFISQHPNINRRGYVYVDLRQDGRRKNAQLHRLVAQNFVPNPLGKPCVHHKDFDVTNCTADNLEWVTHKENTKHTIEGGRQAFTRGEDSNRKVLTEKIVRLIIEDLEHTTLTFKAIAIKWGTNYSNIAHIKRGSRWAHLTRGVSFGDLRRTNERISHGR